MSNGRIRRRRRRRRRCTHIVDWFDINWTSIVNGEWRRIEFTASRRHIVAAVNRIISGLMKIIRCTFSIIYESLWSSDGDNARTVCVVAHMSTKCSLCDIRVGVRTYEQFLVDDDDDDGYCPIDADRALVPLIDTLMKTVWWNGDHRDVNRIC
jgi:hypothetical protein